MFSEQKQTKDQHFVNFLRIFVNKLRFRKFFVCVFDVFLSQLISCRTFFVIFFAFRMFFFVNFFLKSLFSVNFSYVRFLRNIFVGSSYEVLQIGPQHSTKTCKVVSFCYNMQRFVLNKGLYVCFSVNCVTLPQNAPNAFGGWAPAG